LGLFLFLAHKSPNGVYKTKVLLYNQMQELDLKRSELFFTFIKLPVDIIAVLLAFFGAYFLRQVWEFVPVSYMLPFDQYLRFVLIFLPLWILVFAAGGLYKSIEGCKSRLPIFTIFLSVSTAMMIILVYIFFSKISFFSRLVILYVWFLTFFLIVIGRLLLSYIQRYLYRFGIGVHRVAIFGMSAQVKNLVYEIQNNKKLGFKLTGIILKDKRQKTRGFGKFLGCADNISHIIKETPFDELILAEHNLSENQVLNLIDFCEENKINFKLCPNLFNVRASFMVVTNLDSVPIMEFKRTPLDGWGKIMKRIFDFIFSLLILIITSPLFLVIAIAIKLDSRGPIFFRQERVGPERNFIFYKFRSMKTGAEEEHKKFMKKFGVMFKLKNDPRITNLGKFLRATSLDELPQFYNVLKGNMSVVGPRPPMTVEVEKYNPFQRKRLLIKPGITGVWQASGRSDISFEQWVKMDLFYIENWSLWLDLQIIFKTIVVVFKRKGAY